MTAYRDAMSVFTRRFNRLLALALGLPATFFDPHFERPTAWVRLMHYPPEPPGTPSDQYGAAPHTDYGFITFLAQDGLGGLEVRARDGQWIAAPPIAHTFVVNVADMLARWSNDRWLSTPHRVRNVSGRDRYSVPFFWGYRPRQRDRLPPDLFRPRRAPAQRARALRRLRHRAARPQLRLPPAPFLTGGRARHHPPEDSPIANSPDLLPARAGAAQQRCSASRFKC